MTNSSGTPGLEDQHRGRVCAPPTSPTEPVSPLTQHSQPPEPTTGAGLGSLPYGPASMGAPLTAPGKPGRTGERAPPGALLGSRRKRSSFLLGLDSLPLKDSRDTQRSWRRDPCTEMTHIRKAPWILQG